MSEHLREVLGRAIRIAWLKRCRLKPDPRPEQKAEWEEMNEFDRETERCLADAVMETLLHLEDDENEDDL